MEGKSMITIQDVLTAKAFQNSVVLAGENGLSRKVSTITVAELPDSANWLRGEELVCTTAFYISNTVLHQTEWINSIISKGASALAIKTSRFLGVLPSGILEVANEHNFPIIGLPHEITWPIVIESFMDFFMNERIRIMKHVEDIQSQLINMVLDNESIQVFVDKIADLVGNPIVLEDARLNLIAIGKGRDDAHLELDQVVIAKRMHESFRNKILKSDFYKDVQRNRKKDMLEISLPTAQETKTLTIIIPIFSNKSIYGFISLLECRKPRTFIDLLILENSTTSIALQLTKQFVNQQTHRKKTFALIDDLIHGRVQSQIMFEYDFYNMNWSNPMMAILVEFVEPYLENDYFWSRSEELISRILKKHLKIKFDQVIIGSNGSLFTILVSYPPERTKDITCMLKEEMKQALEELDSNLGKDKFLMGIGSAYPDLKMVGKSFKEANTALSIAKNFERKGALIFYEDVGIHRILSMTPNTGDLREFCDDFLFDLKAYDADNGNELVETLHTYLLLDCSIKETAQKMFLHPNTVSYRIKKIKNIVKYDLDLAEFKFTYLFALESDIMLNGSKSIK
jgi:purine catabolism regulator